MDAAFLLPCLKAPSVHPKGTRKERPMKTSKRRGRPKGSGLKGDAKLLDKIADLILVNPSLTPTAAIKKAVPDWNETITRRLRGKWKSQADELLPQARTRMEHAVQLNAAIGTPSNDHGSSPTGASLLQILYSPAFQRSYEIKRLPVVQLARRLRNHPLALMSRSLSENSTLRMVREMQNSPTFKVARELQRLRPWSQL